ncbi:Hypothetical_protein [Hexamita inflata]|uniref:Hypothetical_protein n=1 Tax=Hexamita inflata TaxID=28002 RepID=A0AA86UX73_9EUKA|nr:Hypothetical protein HINF_LOCUS39438 [Hexamita inflata]
MKQQLSVVLYLIHPIYNNILITSLGIKAYYQLYQFERADRDSVMRFDFNNTLQTQKHYALPLIRQSQDSYQPSQRQLQRQLPRSTMFFQVPNQLRLSEEAIQSDNPRR